MTRDTFNQAVVKAARGWIGTPYHHQQSAKDVGTDCLGLVRGVWREMCGAETEAVPHYSSSWKTGGEDVLLKALRRHMEPVYGIGYGRVLAFRFRPSSPVQHVAISTSATTMIHAYHERAAFEVEITRSWMKRLAACFEFPLPEVMG